MIHFWRNSRKKNAIQPYYMPNKEKYNLDFRPTTYWLPKRKLTSTIATRYDRSIKKAFSVRREKEHSASKRAAGLISSFERPLMNEDYLPELLKGQVEIARIVLFNTGTDKWSIRARREGKMIQYQVVDEFQSFYSCSPYQ